MHLNLPTRINFHNKEKDGEKFIAYLYTAQGRKVRRHVMDNTGQGTNLDSTTDYLGGFQYLDGNLEFFPTAEGYVRVIEKDFHYVYNYTDHLGNIRLSYTREGNELRILEESHYYPFGQLVPNRHGSSDSYRYGYQGQEKDDEIKGEGNSLNFNNRMHDPRVGRFFAIDPLYREFPYYSPYQFAGNNPIYALEFEGLEPMPSTENITKTSAVLKKFHGGFLNLAVANSNNTSYSVMCQIRCFIK